MPRQPAGQSSINLRRDGRYHTDVVVGHRPDGTPIRRHVSRDTAAEVADARDELLAGRRQSGRAVLDKTTTVGQWLGYYLEVIVKPNHPQSTWRGYRTLITQHAIPVLGPRRLVGPRNPLEPEHLDELYERMRRTGGRSGKGMAASSIVKMHRVLSRSFDVAVKRGRATRNVCHLIDAPTARKTRSVGYHVDDAQRLLAAAVGDRLRARWLLGLLLGPRQGEALGVRWPQLRLADEAPTLTLITQIQRNTWQHGCPDPDLCAGQFCRRSLCPPSWQHGCPDETVCRKNPRCCPQRQPHPCRRHTRPCPAPCPPGCVRHAARCPQRRDGGLEEVDLKSEGSERTLPLPAAVVEALQQRRQDQMREAHHRGERWDDQDLVFTRPDGRALDPRADYDAWQALVARAGVPKRRLHAARHTAATVLLATGTDITVVKEILGHADLRTAQGYVDVAKELKAEAAQRAVEALLNGNLHDMITRTKEATR